MKVEHIRYGFDKGDDFEGLVRYLLDKGIKREGSFFVDVLNERSQCGVLNEEQFSKFGGSMNQAKIDVVKGSRLEGVLNTYMMDPEN